MERWPGIEILYMSGYTDDEVRRRGVRVPGVAFIEKPITFEVLGRAVRRALDTVMEP
jgi:FixJ family two-component response regulator